MRKIPFGMPMIGDDEKNAVLEVLKGPILVHGPRGKEFEDSFAQFTKASHAISVSSCTAALHLSYFYLGIGPGDEVIVPAETHVATAHAVELCGGKPIFVDSEEKTGNLDIDQIEEKITERTRAISVVHFLGMPVEMDRISSLARKHRLFVVEDCALAVGSYFKNIHVGLHGDVGCFSFYPVKHFTTAEGGMLITRNEEIAKKIRLQRAFGVDRPHDARSVPGVYDVSLLGFNYRMNEIQAALGIEQLKRVNGFLKRRRENYEALSSALKEIEEIHLFRSTEGAFQSSYYCLSFCLKETLFAKRPEIINSLKEDGIGTSVYYPQPVPQFTYFKTKYGYSEGSFPVASWISNSSIALPVGPHLDGEDITYVAQSVKKAIHEARTSVGVSLTGGTRQR